ncbi:TetR/AcrR family transcriptional regulator [Egibacter rhizosphaerae]|uniref:TetR/AcrR family transcriptional regulator n=1 Tax=Egibacter rhizosphaerae TaxID=1670831 RepID=UPI0013F14B76|nr:TetR/AcrR family transcriptional regulator [Egibacter rhizosphaerae]
MEPSNARSRRTRGALLGAARAILENEGFDALTMAAVARRAGVTRRAVYLHFSSRAELLANLFGYVAQAEGLADSLERVWQAPDGPTALERWAHHLADYHPRIMAVDRAIQQVEARDPDAAAHRERVSAAQLEGCGRIVAQLADEGCLAAGWTRRTATDFLFALISTDMFERLLFRGWSSSELSEHLAGLLRATFVDADTTGFELTSPQSPT